MKHLFSQSHKISGFVPIRILLVVPFVLQIGVAVGLTGWLSLHNGQQAVNQVTSQLRSEVVARVEVQLRNYLAIPRLLNQVNLNALSLGQFNLQDTASVTRQFWNQRHLFDSVVTSSIFYGDREGEFTGIGYQDDGTWQIGKSGKSTQGKFHLQAIDNQGNPSTLLKIGKPYDPRQRPWYTSTVSKGKPTWSEIYTDFQYPKLTITLGQPVYNSAGVLQGVVGVDFVLSHIGEFLQNIKIGKSGQIFIIERSGLLVATSTPQKPFVVTPKEVKRLKAVDLKTPLIRATATYLSEYFGDLSKIQSNQQLDFKIKGERHFLQVVPFSEGENLDWLIVVVVPESDFMEQINANTRTTILLCLAALFVATTLGIFTSRWIAKPILRLNLAAKAIACGELNQKVKVEGIYEIATLANSFNQMAEQLRSAFAALEEANAELERRVEARTALLKEAEAELRALFEAMTEYVFVCDREGRYLKIAPTNPTIVYKTARELTGRTFHEFWPQQQADTFVSYVRDVLDHQQASTVEYSLTMSEQTRWFFASISPINSESVVWVARDITERKMAEAALQLEQEKFTRAFRSSPNPLSITTIAEGRFIEVNDSFLEVFNYKSHQVIGYTVFDLKLWVNAEECDYLVEVLQRQGSIRNFECSLRTKLGAVRTTLISSEVLDFGEQKCIISVFNDITERKQAEVALAMSEAKERENALQLAKALQELQLAQAKLVQSEKMSSLGQMVAGVAHEINNPIGFIYGNIDHAKIYINELFNLIDTYQEAYPNPTQIVEQMLKDIEVDFIREDLPKLLYSMKGGAERIRDIVLSLRNFSRLDESEMKPVDIHSGLESTLLILHSRLQSNEKNQQIQVKREYEKLPKVTCYAGQLNQVFMNILSNAIEALEPSLSPSDNKLCNMNPTITIRTSQSSESVMISIADNGPGIEEEVISNIFDPFFTTKPVGSGTGLGLSISYSIVVEKHGGRLSCLSAPGLGAEFIIEIPLHPANKIKLD